MDQAEGLRRLKEKEIPAVSMNSSQGALTITAITGGKGGVGKSNIALNLGLSLAKKGERVCLLDADFGLANIDVLIGLKPRYHMGHVLNGTKTLAEILLKGPGGIEIIPAASGLKHLAGLSEAALSPFLEQAKNLGKQFDRLIIDTPAGISGDVITLLKSAGEIVVVVTPEPTSYTDAYALIKVMRFEKSNLRIKIVMNMCPTVEEGTRIGHRLRVICQSFLGFQPELSGVISQDPNVVRAIRRQRPFFESFPETQASREVSLLADRLHRGVVKSSDLGEFFSSMKEFIT